MASSHFGVYLKRSKNFSVRRPPLPFVVRPCPSSSALRPSTSPDIAHVRPPTWGRSYKCNPIQSYTDVYTLGQNSFIGLAPLYSIGPRSDVGEGQCQEKFFMVGRTAEKKRRKNFLFLVAQKFSSD